MNSTNILSIPGNFNENPSWLPKVKEGISETGKQEDIRIDVENVKTTIRKTGKRLALTMFGYWYKKFSIRILG